MDQPDRTNNWLFKQSSELELLISAAIVFASIKFGNVVEEMIWSMLNNNVASDNEWLVILAVISLFASKLLPFSIIAHFVLRFYWLSLVGLRSVFHKNADSRIYTKKFDDFLQKYLNLDQHIDKVDRISSSVFAFSFLTLFAFCFSITSILIVIFVIADGVSGYFDLQWVDNLVYGFDIVFIAICAIYMIDFFTLGWFKQIKSKWFQKIYFPIYRAMGIITFSFLYRGIYYTLIQYTSKRFMAFLLPAYTCLTIFLLNAGYNPYRLYDSSAYDFSLRDQMVKPVHYLENFEESTVVQWPFIDRFAIPEGTNYLKLYIPITGRLEDSLLTWCPEIVAVNDSRSIHWRKYINTDLNRKEFPDDFDFRKNADLTLACVKANSEVLIDTSMIEIAKFRFERIWDPSRLTFMTVLDLDSISRGDHTLIVKMRYRKDDPIEYHIPFWKD